MQIKRESSTEHKTAGPVFSSMFLLHGSKDERSVGFDLYINSDDRQIMIILMVP